MTTVIINEQHSLLNEQMSILCSRFPGFETLLVPATGWDYDTQMREAAKLSGRVIFVSPIPLMIKALTKRIKTGTVVFPDGDVLDVLIFANDRREKKELPNGKTISVVAKTGWYLA